MARYRELDERTLATYLELHSSGLIDKEQLGDLVKHYLARIQSKAPGASVELRVPPFGAVQIVAGARHTRGTPPAVVEMGASVWVDLAIGALDWDKADKQASGERSDISGLLPLD